MKADRHKTPLRYPGGKQKLAPFILEVLQSNDLIGAEYVEPFAGGAGVAIELLLTGNVSKIHLNDSCRAIFAFWKSVLNFTEEFCRRIVDTPLTVAEWKRRREVLMRPAEFDMVDVGFSAFYLNRCNRSGIIAGGGIIGGLKQAGEWKMNARYPKEKLINRIKAIADKRKSIRISNLDAEQFIKERIPTLPKKALVYCDPPYFEKANRLYFNHYKPEDHKRIAVAVQAITHPWIVSYDKVPQVLKCYSDCSQFSYSLQYNAATARKGKEVLFFSPTLILPAKSILHFVNRPLLRIQKFGRVR